MNIRTGLLLVSLWSLASAAAGQPRVARVDPPFWWTGMRQDTLELLITGNAFARALVSTPGEGIRILATEAAAENSALFVTLCILPDAQPGSRRLSITTPEGKADFQYVLRAREDTYPYCDQEYLNAWCAAILQEYPRLNIVGEVWMNEAPSIASFQRGNRLAPRRESALPTVTDFPPVRSPEEDVRTQGRDPCTGRLLLHGLLLSRARKSADICG